MDVEREDGRTVQCRGCGEQFYEVEIDRDGYCEKCAEVYKRVGKLKEKDANRTQGR
jgi:ribosomal protein L37E